MRSQMTPTACGTPWLGFVVYPNQRRLKARKVTHATRRLIQRYADYEAGLLSFAEFDASLQGWINHARVADTWGLHRQMLSAFVMPSGNLSLRRGQAAFRRRLAPDHE